MAREKKTVDVKTIKQFANQILEDPEINHIEKLGVIAMLEKILHEANAYKGFMFTSMGHDNTPPAAGTKDYLKRKYF